MTLAPLPERELFEREIHELVNGDMSEVARLLRFDYSTVSRAFNPFKPDRHNPFYLAACYLWAFDYLRPDLGDAVVNILLRERGKWKAEDVVITDQPAALTKSIGTQLVEAIETEMEGESIDDQIDEYHDVKVAVEKKIADLSHKRKLTSFGGPVSTKTRSTIRELVQNKKAS